MGFPSFTKSLRLVAAAFLVCACTSQAKLPTDAEPGLAPYPYTTEQIRDAHPPGSTLVFRLQMEGQPTVVRKMRFVSGDSEHTVMEEVVSPEQANAAAPAAAPKRMETTWADLRKHASFPAEKTKLTHARCEVPAGKFDCWLYTVELDEGGKPTLMRYYFAPHLPGPPVLLEKEQGGVNVLRMELVESTKAHS